jgi:hypothetical protein
MKEAYYFSHDSNAKQDPKILSLRADFGMEGYGVYWGIVEALREQENFKIRKDLMLGIIVNLGVENTKAIQMYNKMIQIELLCEEENYIYSKSLLKRMEKKQEISQKRKEAISKRWAKNKEKNTKVIQKNTIVIQGKEKKGKERKGNNIEQPGGCVDINPLIKLFEEINPVINYGHRTNRSSLEELVKKYGYEKTEATIKYAISIQGQKYAPVITTPWQLKNKIGELLIYHQKENSSSKFTTI